MARLAIFIERYAFSRSAEFEALMRFRAAAEELGHQADVLFRRELKKIPNYDAVLIRALTDPMNSSFVASRMAELHGKPVIDDSRSILVCCDKIHMYRRLAAARVPTPRTAFVGASQVGEDDARRLFDELGPRLVLKAPNSCFSQHVEVVRTPAEFADVGRRFLRRADRLVVQEFVESEFDWRIGVLGGEPLFACRYVIPEETFKILAVVDGRKVECRVEAVPLAQAPARIVSTAKLAAAAVGDGLYGVDLKDVDDGPVVIEVNDNPTINADEEDRCAPDLYAKIVRSLLGRVSHQGSRESGACP
jgi:glutathione synthase/RimK-type ligase-like ATP-grasp enzyme